MNISQIPTASFSLGRFLFTINPQTLITSAITCLFLILLGIFLGRGLSKFPNRKQCVAELIIKSFQEIIKDELGKDWAKFFPLITTLFLFILLSNWIGIIPGLKPPTADLNTCLGLGLLVFFISHISAIRENGFRNYIKKYFSPFFFLFPINLISELGKVVSHSFRLFGNMFGGAIIFAVVGPIVFEISKAIGMPLAISSPLLIFIFLILQVFFGLFIGTVQAFVFSILALTYIGFARE